MILRALYELAAQEQLVSDPHFPLTPVAWLVAVSADGAIHGITGTHELEPASGKRKPRLIPRARRVPYQPGRSGTKAPPYFLVDNAKYVFGMPTPDKPFSPDEGKEKSAWFRESIADCVRATGDDGARAVLRALESVADGRQTVRLPDDCKSNELFAFVYEADIDVCVHDRPVVQEYWRSRRRDSSGGADSGARCLVTGTPADGPANFPKTKSVPGGQSSGAALVSFNAPAFESYGLRGNENAPISRDAAEAAATALQRLVHPAFPDPRPARAGSTLPRRHVRVGDDTLVCYWSNSPATDPLLDVLGALLDGSDPAEVGELYRSIWRGRPAPVSDPGAFYALTLSGAQGRMIVRDWFESTVAQVNDNLARHFADLAIVRNTPAPKDRPPPEHVPLHVLVAALAPLGRRENVPAPLAGALIHAALHGTPYPYAVLQRAVERMRAEIGRTEWADLERRDARAALIKAVLRRTLNREIRPDMDITNTNPGYLCGRLMAVLERLQQVALGDVNASVVDRYFGAASATPRAVFVRLLRSAQHHARKAQDDPARGRTAAWLKRQVDEISTGFDPKHNGFPSFLTLEDQGLFVLGYHQQRHALWSKRSGSEPERDTLPGSAPA